MDDDEEHSGDDKNQRARPPSAYTQLRNFKSFLCATKVELQFFSFFFFLLSNVIIGDSYPRLF
jgi:hypothetical protein